MKLLIQKIMQKWGIHSIWDFIIISFVFSLAGMSIVFVRKPVFHLFGITHETAFWIKAMVYLPVVFPTYQLNLLIFGFLFGKFDFFWAKEKKLLQFLIGSKIRKALNKS